MRAGGRAVIQLFIIILPVDAVPEGLHGLPVVRLSGAALALLVALMTPCAEGCATTGDAPAPGAADFRGETPPSPPPTWFRDVEPIVQRECTGCHTKGGTGGFPLDRETSRLLASFIAERVTAGDMPPWPPDRDGPPIVDARGLDARAVATIAAWAAAGAPEGDPSAHVERGPQSVSAPPPRPADLRLSLPEGDAYREHPSVFVTDEVRCFVLELPRDSSGVWVTAARWIAGTPVGVHQLGGVVVDAEGARDARARSGGDGRAGFECGGGLGTLTRGPSLGANGTGNPMSGATLLPEGTAVRIPKGGAVVMRVHYAVKHLAGMTDRSGVDLWVADERERARVRPLLLHGVSAPVEVPCPTGISSDPNDACSREAAFARLALADAAGAKAREAAMIAACGTSLDALTATSTAATGAGEHFYASTSCDAAAPFDGTIRVVHARMQTRGAKVRVEAQRSDGSWATVLHIPRWRWAWDSAYVLREGVPIAAGSRLRVSCTFDNGTANQWSALTGEPGHGTAARPPRLAPGYLVAAPHRGAEACDAWVGVERAPHRGASWATLCHEAEAVHADSCGKGMLDLTTRGCTADDEDAAVRVLAMSPAMLRASCR